ncbi:hypothetical protein OIU83_12970 [Flavobacterium sp. LS1R49]|uniref:Uncharacterized protein n=1 Tax=Flavobacterium shii TaxID=2987687 RepID=A0A9X3C7I4_9FLAO|nr:hypothetical protein [Flavobacterium shii]MCV9928573.1 hypothetical protein [Flavobacterium shii]
MSYLNVPRLTFSGDFISDVSTVNNDTQHYNNSTFQSKYQKPKTEIAANGWWNPEGGATFGFQDCHVKQIIGEDGTSTSDPLLDDIIGQIVCGAEGRNSGKMVDLDPQQQMVSQLWGVTFRILTAKNELLLEGKIDPTGFRNLQMRQQTGGKVNGQPFGGTWTSVIEDVVWGDLAHSSPFLMALKSKTQENKLSINLNAFGYYYNHAKDGRFSLGRILGGLGPWFTNEPKLFAPARRLYGIIGDAPNDNPKTQQPIFFGASNFLFDKKNARLSIDLGSSFPISDSMGNISLNTNLVLAVSKKSITFSASDSINLVTGNDVLFIGEVEYEKGADWINTTSAILDFNNLSNDVVSALEDNQLLLLGRASINNMYSIIAREAIDGIVIRADNFVQRLDTNQTNEVRLYAYQFGVPLQNKNITITQEPPTAVSPKKDNQPPICDIPGNNYPAAGLTFDTTIVTDNNGLAILKLTGNSINCPREYLDGQIYTLDYQLTNVPIDAASGSVMPDNFIAIHLRDHYEIPNTPVWSDIKPTMIQFANLYPIMSKFFIDFSDPDALIAKKDLLIFAFDRDIHDPIYMPVTRDLSENKRLTILKWLNNPIIDEQIVLSTEKKVVDANLAEELLQAKATPLTDYQKQLKDAVRAKNGSNFSSPEIKNLFEF